jgi:hypothetical protein
MGKGRQGYKGKGARVATRAARVARARAMVRAVRVRVARAAKAVRGEGNKGKGGKGKGNEGGKSSKGKKGKKGMRARARADKGEGHNKGQEYTVSAVSCCIVMELLNITEAVKNKITIGHTDDCQFTTLVNSASTAPPIGLLPMGAKFCHTLNILLVAHQCRHALSRLYFNSSAVGCWSVGWLVKKKIYFH